MNMDEARELVASAIWPQVRDSFLASGTFEVYPIGDLRRIQYLDVETQAKIAAWQTAVDSVEAWRKIVDGAQVRDLKARYPEAYPEVFRYQVYFKPSMSADEKTKLILKLKFPEAYKLCYS